MKKRKVSKMILIMIECEIVKIQLGNTFEEMFDLLFSSIFPEWFIIVIFCIGDIGLEMIPIKKRKLFQGLIPNI